MLEKTRIWQVLQRSINIDPVQVFMSVSTDDVLRKIVELNREQLMQGLDAAGRLLSDIGGEYADLTLELHPEKSRFTITLFDTGAYHESITARVTPEGYIIEGDHFKEDFGYITDLTERWGEDIEGLNEESLAKLSQEVLIRNYVEYFKTQILRV